MKSRWKHASILAIIFCVATGLPVLAQTAGAVPQAVVTAAASEPADAFNWRIEHADAPQKFQSMSTHSMGITTSGVIHVVYGGDHLYHAWKGRGGWNFETVDPAWGVGSQAALAIDSANGLHVSYLDSAANRLKYATNRSGSWQAETLSMAAGLITVNAVIALDSADDPHIVFASNDNALRYGFFDSGLGIWIGPETIAAASGTANHLNYPGAFALALGPTATPHVTYHKHVSDSNGSLYYTKRTGYNTWSAPQTLAIGGDSGGDYNDIALNGSIPHVAAGAYYSIAGLYRVEYTFLDGASWHPVEIPVESTYGVPAAISLRLAGTTPIIAYQASGAGYYWLSRSGDNAWTSAEAVVSGASVGSWSSFAWYNNYPYATYYDTATQQFAFKNKTATGWQASFTLATNGHSVGYGSSIQVDTLGRSHLVYQDGTALQLLYARFDGANWYRLTVDTGPVFGDTSLVLENNLPKVLYYGKDGSVRFTSMLCAPICTFINPEIVDSGLTVPIYASSLAVHTATGMQAAYNKNGTLMYAKRTGANAWSKTIVDTEISGSVSLALDTSGAPHLAYRKGENLLHAYKDTSWHTDDIIATGAFSSEPTFKISSQGLKAAVYTLHSGGIDHLVYSVWSCPLNLCAWWPQTIETTSLFFDYVSLAFDGQGEPHIAYFVDGSVDLKFAERSGAAAWTTNVIDSRGLVGLDASMALSPLTGQARIAYFDLTNEDLKLALEGQKVFVPLVKK